VHLVQVVVPQYPSWHVKHVVASEQVKHPVIPVHGVQTAEAAAPTIELLAGHVRVASVAPPVIIQPTEVPGAVTPKVAKTVHKTVQ
jgi:hypothetical protein